MISSLAQQEFILLHKKGESMRFIAKETGHSINTVKKYLMRNGYVVNTKNIIKKLKSNNKFLIGLYCGLWAGDGTQYYDEGYVIKFCCHSDCSALISFIQELLMKLFDKESKVYFEKRHRATVKCMSEFIFNFSRKYLLFRRNKGYTVKLKYSLSKYSKKFIEGFLLGLTLSDGHLKKNFSYSTTSRCLAKNVTDILESIDFTSRLYIHKREKYGWKDLHMIRMKKNDSI